MKKLFSILIFMLISAPAFSQTGVPRLIVQNKTACDQTYVVFGGNLCPCSEVESYHSDFITIPAGMTFDHPNLHALGGIFPPPNTPSVYLYGTRITEGFPEFCGIKGGTVGQYACGAISLTHSFTALNSDCTDCAPTNATWHLSSCEGEAILIFE